MEKIDCSSMQQVENRRIERERRLNELLSTPFNPDNPEQIKALTRYNNDFESSVNLMYLYQGLSTGMTIWFSSWVIGRILPIPQSINYTLASCLYLGGAAYILQQYRMTDFNEQLNEMKRIYSWVKSSINNSSINEILGAEQIQRAIKLIAPLCSTDFIMAWAKESSNKDVPLSSLYNALDIGCTSLLNPLRLFFNQHRPEPMRLERIRQLKTDVERRHFDVKIYDGFANAMSYFISSSNFKQCLEHPVDTLKQILPSTVVDSITAWTSSFKRD